MTHAIGIDGGLKNVGFAGAGPPETIKTGDLAGAERLDYIYDEVAKRLTVEKPGFCLLEGYAFAGRGAHQLGEAGGIIRLALFHGRVPFSVVAPKSLKKWFTGSGGANKDRMIAEAKLRLRGDAASITDEHQADATALRWLALEALGEPTPMGDLQAHQLTAVTTLRKKLPRDLRPDPSTKLGPLV